VSCPLWAELPSWHGTRGRRRSDRKPLPLQTLACAAEALLFYFSALLLMSCPQLQTQCHITGSKGLGWLHTVRSGCEMHRQPNGARGRPVLHYIVLRRVAL
jgi:hypothetical protein